MYANHTDMLNKLASYIGIQSWSKSTVAAKEMIELLAPKFDESVKPVRKYYFAMKDDEVVPTPRVKTDERFAEDRVTLNVPFVDNTTCYFEKSNHH